MRVVVVGGGVAGLASALQLGRAGHEVTVVERDDTPMPATADEAFEWDRRGAPPSPTRTSPPPRKMRQIVRQMHIPAHVSGWWSGSRAYGRRSAMAEWLEAIGVPPIAETVDDTGIVYASRFYRLLPDGDVPPRTGPIGGDLGYIKYGVVPGDRAVARWPRRTDHVECPPHGRLAQQVE